MRHLISLHLLQLKLVLRLTHHLLLHHESWYRVTYIVHRVASELSITIPNDSYYYNVGGDYDDNEIPVLTFYEGDQSILSLSAESTPTEDGHTQIATSSLITQFVFTSN